MARSDADRAPVLLRRTRHGLSPVSSFDAERVEQIAMGQTVEVAIKQRRSSQHQRLYWAVLGKVVENVEGYPTSERLHDALKLALGYTTPIRQVTGETVWLPDSTAFARMEQAEFKVFTDRAFRLLADMLGCDPLALVNEAKEAVA